MLLLLSESTDVVLALGGGGLWGLAGFLLVVGLEESIDKPLGRGGLVGGEGRAPPPVDELPLVGCDEMVLLLFLPVNLDNL